MAHRTHSDNPPAVKKNENRLLLSAFSGLIKYFALSLGMTTSLSLVFFSWAALIKVSGEHHIVYDFAAFSSGAFRHFLLVVGGVLAGMTLVAAAFVWAFISSLRNSKDIDDFEAYLRYRQRRRNSARPPSSVSAKNGPVLPYAIGIASILDFGNTLSRSTPGITPRQQDYLALKSDWAAVGDDLQAALDKADQDFAQNKKGAAVGSTGRTAR